VVGTHPEYAIGNIVVAISWSGYFNLLKDWIHLPAWLTVDPGTARSAFEMAQATAQIAATQ
jgi:hypothetical protein